MWFNVRVFLISIWLSDGIFSISIYKPSDKIEKSYQSDDYDLGHNTCFPSSDHIISIPDIDQPIPNLQELNQWWCSHSSQYAWLGYSYSVSEKKRNNHSIIQDDGFDLSLFCKKKE